MKFYNRENELKLLRGIELQSKASSKMSFIVGRRRIGKTTLIKESYKNSNLVYFFVSKKNESLLCEEFITSAQTVAEIKFFGKFTKWRLVISMESRRPGKASSADGTALLPLNKIMTLER